MLLFIILVIIIFNIDVLNYTFCHSVSKLLLSFIPYLFIQVFLGNICLNHLKINKLYIKLNNFFKSSNIYSLKIVLLSFIIGSIPATKLINKLYEEEIIDYNESRYLLSFCLYVNPLFVISIFNSYGYLILISNVISNLLISQKYKKNKVQFYNENIIQKDFSNTIVESINLFVDSSLKAFGTITLFSYIINIFNKYINNSIIKLFYPIIELSNLSIYNSFTILGISLASFICAFGGISLIIQIKANLNNSFNIYDILKYRIISGIISALITGGVMLVIS